MSTQSGQVIQVTNLTVENRRTPLGMDVEKPKFSWQMSVPGNERGYLQKSYQLLVKNEQHQVVWDTGKVQSDQSIHIPYSGMKLKATERYSWTVSIWDQDDHTATESSWFETGLMDSDKNLTGWDGATWIGGSESDLPFYSHYLSIFSIKYSLRLVPGSTRAGFVINANDSRLMDKYKNIYQMEVGKDESYLKFELDVSDVDGSENGLAKLHIYRVGFVATDSATLPFSTVTIPSKKINQQTKYEEHHLMIQGIFGAYQVFLNGIEKKDIIFDGVVNPVGHNHDYLTHVGMLADIGFSLNPHQKASFTNIEVNYLKNPQTTVFKEDLTMDEYQGIYADEIDESDAGITYNDGAISMDGGDKGFFLVKDPSQHSMPMLRSEFSVEEKKIKKARLYVTARGIYEIFLNGERVGEDYFTPGFTQYNKTHMYQTYDVTEMVDNGQNGIGAMLAEGWWSGLHGFGSNWNQFGDRQSLLAKLVITYEDDTTKVVTTNPSEWKYYNQGPIRYSSLFMGEVYDATKESAVIGWSQHSFNDKGWKHAVEIPADKTTTWDGYRYDNLQIIGHIGENASIVETRTAKSVTEVRPNVYVYDMGQNMVGVPKVTLTNGKENHKVTLRVAEMLYPDLPESGENVGMIMQENLRAALCQDIYICKDGEQTIKPYFTFHGYRYLEITGIEEPLPLECVQGEVISSIKELTSAYSTSNPLVNKLWENITWSMRGNFLSIPTDTPARNERMGWNGDIGVFCRTATYLADVNQFLKRHNLANRDIQDESGRYSDIAPVGPGFGGILWGSAGINVPWELYQQYGDVTVLEEHYESMKKYMSYLDTRVNEETGLIDEGPLGDWLSPEYDKTENALIWTSYHAYNFKLMTNISKVLGFKEDAKLYVERYLEKKNFFNNTFVDKDTKKTINSDGTLSDSQVSYAVPLAQGIVKEEYLPEAATHLANTVIRKNRDDSDVLRPGYSLMTGFIGTTAINQALSENGYHDVAYRLLQQTSYPSWLYSVKNGATTIWERLNSYTVEEGFGGNNSMNSFNHYSFGAVGAWMYTYSLGIQRDPDRLGFKHFILQPTPDPDAVMTWARGHYDSMYGRIKSAWQIEEEYICYHVTVPANTTATLYLSTNHPEKITEDGQSPDKVTGVRFVEYTDGKAVYALQSGSYEFCAIR